VQGSGSANPGGWLFAERPQTRSNRQSHRSPVESERHCNYCSGTGKHFHTAARPMDVRMCEPCLGTGCCIATPREPQRAPSAPFQPTLAPVPPSPPLAPAAPPARPRGFSTPEGKAKAQAERQEVEAAAQAAALASYEASVDKRRKAKASRPPASSETEDLVNMKQVPVQAPPAQIAVEEVAATPSPRDVPSPRKEPEPPRQQLESPKKLWQGRPSKPIPKQSEEEVWRCEAKGTVKPLVEKEAPDAELKKVLANARINFARQTSGQGITSGPGT